MESGPVAAGVYARVATPDPLSVAVPNKEVPLLKKDTVPAGPALPVTVAVSDTEVPTTTLVADT